MGSTALPPHWQHSSWLEALAAGRHLCCHTFRSYSLKIAEVLNSKPCRCIYVLWPLHVPVTWPQTQWLAASLTWSCRPGVIVFLVDVINSKPCRCTGQARGRRGCGCSASHTISDWQSLAASLTWSCRPCVTVLALQQYGDARCWSLTAGDWDQQLAAEAGPGNWHSNYLKCSTSGLKVFSCYAMLWCLLWSKYSLSHKNEFCSRSLSKQRFSSDDNKWQTINLR